MVKQCNVTCHSTEKHKGDIDLEKFTSLSAVQKHPEPWERVYEEVSMDEMPPKEKPQPTSEDRAPDSLGEQRAGKSSAVAGGRSWSGRASPFK